MLRSGAGAAAGATKNLAQAGQEQSTRGRPPAALIVDVRLWYERTSSHRRLALSFVRLC